MAFSFGSLGGTVKTVFSTSGVHPRDRFDYWHTAVCRDLIPHDSVADSRQAFHAELQTGTLSGIKLVMFSNAPLAVSHTTRHLRHAEPDELFFCRQISGSLALSQNGREALLRNGDLALVDPRLPYEGKFAGESRSLVLKVPRGLIESRVGNVRELLLSPFKRSAPEVRLASEFISMLPDHVHGIDACVSDLVQNHALDLIALVLGRSRLKQGSSAARADVREKLRMAIEARLTDTTLSAGALAKAAGVSLRYANAALRDDGLSVMRLLQVRRLEHCRKALSDPAQANRTIGDIAYGWGFRDLTHFGRSFKTAFGHTPRAYRQSAMRSSGTRRT